MASTEYIERLNVYHMQLATVDLALAKLLREIDDEHLSAVGELISDRLHFLVEHCPFPGSQEVSH